MEITPRSPNKARLAREFAYLVLKTTETHRESSKMVRKPLTGTKTHQREAPSKLGHNAPYQYHKIPPPTTLMGPTIP